MCVSGLLGLRTVPTFSPGEVLKVEIFCGELFHYIILSKIKFLDLLSGKHSLKRPGILWDILLSW